MNQNYAKFFNQESPDIIELLASSTPEKPFIVSLPSDEKIRLHILSVVTPHLIQEASQKGITDIHIQYENEPFSLSAKDIKDHVSSLGVSGSNKSKVEDKFTEASKEHGMILVIKSNTLPSEAMNQEVDLKGRVIIASVINDHTDEVDEFLENLNLDNEKMGDIVELAIAHLSNKQP